MLHNAIQGMYICKLQRKATDKIMIPLFVIKNQNVIEYSVMEAYLFDKNTENNQ